MDKRTAAALHTFLLCVLLVSCGSSWRPGTAKVIIPEGFRLNQIFERLSRELDISTEEFRKVEEDARARASLLGFDAASLEGCILPLTYSFSRHSLRSSDAAFTVLERMIHLSFRRIEKAIGTKPSEFSMETYHSLIVASLIEKETADTAERRLVSSVIRNRLQSGMKLELCSSLLYVLPEGKTVITDVDINHLSQYNTYRHPGLPPTPICSPGIDALDAAMHPSETGFLYFKLGRDGQHVFSGTYAEHLQVERPE